jgi:hypothetical protein
MILGSDLLGLEHGYGQQECDLLGPEHDFGQ